jgi:hypothetical protein
MINDADIEMMEAAYESDRRHALTGGEPATPKTIAMVTRELVEAINSGRADSPSLWITDYLADTGVSMTSAQAESIHWTAWERSEQ